jgi:hypothetical protein
MSPKAPALQCKTLINDRQYIILRNDVPGQFREKNLNETEAALKLSPD